MVGGAWIRALLHRRKPQWTRNPGLHACAHTHHTIRTHARTHPPTQSQAHTMSRIHWPHSLPRSFCSYLAPFWKLYLTRSRTPLPSSFFRGFPNNHALSLCSISYARSIFLILSRIFPSCTPWHLASLSLPLSLSNYALPSPAFFLSSAGHLSARAQLLSLVYSFVNSIISYPPCTRVLVHQLALLAFAPSGSARILPVFRSTDSFAPRLLLLGVPSFFSPRLTRFVPPDPSTNSSRFDRMSLRLLRSTILLTDTRDNLRRSDGGRLSVGHTRRVLILSATLDYTYPKDHAMRANG